MLRPRGVKPHFRPGGRCCRQRLDGKPSSLFNPLLSPSLITSSLPTSRLSSRCRSEHRSSKGERLVCLLRARPTGEHFIGEAPQLDPRSSFKGIAAQRNALRHCSLLLCPDCQHCFLGPRPTRQQQRRRHFRHFHPLPSTQQPSRSAAKCTGT